MPHYEAKMTSKGQLTVPGPVRERLGLEAGDIVDFYVDETLGEIRLSARNKDVSELFGSLNSELGGVELPVTVDAMNEAVARRVAAADERIVRDWRKYQEFLAWRRRKNRRAAG